MSRKENGDLAGQLFGIHHYAGEVSYHAATMVTQNVDSLFSDVLHLLAASESSFISNLFSEDPEAEEVAAEERAKVRFCFCFALHTSTPFLHLQNK
jgi:myosin heavy subunit